MRSRILPLAIAGLVLVALVLSLALPAVGGAVGPDDGYTFDTQWVTTAPTDDPRLESAQRQWFAQRAGEQGAAFANKPERRIEAPHGQGEMPEVNGAASQSGQVTPAEGAVDYVPDQVIVKFKREAAGFARASLNEDLGTSAIYTSPYAGFSVLQIPEGQTVAEMVQAYSAQSFVEYAEPNYIRRAAWSPNDPDYSYQWHFDQINLEAAWDLDTTAPYYGGDPGIIVAVLDSGVAYENYGAYQQAPDLANTNFAPGYDFVNRDSHPNDDTGHGTHVAGTIAQSTGNALGVAGIAFNTTIMPVKVLDHNGFGTVQQEADGIYYAVDNGARIINMSLGDSSTNLTERNALAYAYEHGVTVIAAAGNDYAFGNDPSYPAAYDDYVIAVGATRYDQNRAPYSNTGSYVDLVAPGGDTTVDQNGDGHPDGILQQTFPGGDPTDFGTYFLNGTSMASPHVAGVAALILARNPGWTPDQVRQALESTATDLGAAGRDDVYGWGLLNAAAAVAWPPIVSLSSTAYGVSEGGATATITANLSLESPQTVTIDYATSDATASAPGDYTSVSGTLTFDPGQTTKTFSIPIVDDDLDEGDETVNLTLSDPTDAALGAPNTAILTIADNDTAEVSFSSATYNVAEVGGAANITANLSLASTQTVTVDYTTGNGSASAPGDYTAANGTLTFNPGQTTSTFNVPIIDDDLDEGNETVNLTLSDPTNAALGAPNTAVLTIADNDTAEVSLSSATYNVAEDGGTATITANLSLASTQTVTVAFATSNGSASAPGDYTTANGTLTFTPGQTTMTFDIPIIDDDLNEGNETVNLTLSDPTNAVLGTPNTAVLTIADDDVPPPPGYRDIPLVQGWNLISLPLIPDDNNIAVVTAGIDPNLTAVHAYDAATAQWTQYDGAGGAFDTLATMNHSLGYWFQMAAADTLTVWGQAALVPDIEAPPGAEGYHDTTLVQGWTLVGLPLIPTDEDIAVVTLGIGPNLIAVHSYNAATAQWTQYDGPGGAFDTLATMGDGLGYWFQMSAPDTLTVWGTDGLQYE